MPDRAPSGILAGMHLGGGERVQRWERHTGKWLVGLAVAFLAAYAIPILWPDLPDYWHTASNVTNWLVWAAFMADYLVRLALADDRWTWFRTHPFDLAVLILPMLRPLRLLQLVKAFMVIERRTEVWTRGKLAVYVAATVSLLVVVSALAILDAERNAPDGNISGYGDALWWSMVTVTTVGYGDHFPVTAAGRAVAVAMMLCGIGLLGFVTGSLASWVLERITVVSKATEDTHESLADVLAEVRMLRSEMAALRRQAGHGQGQGLDERHGHAPTGGDQTQATEHRTPTSGDGAGFDPAGRVRPRTSDEEHHPPAAPA